MILHVETVDNHGRKEQMSGTKTIQQLNHIMQLVAAAYSDDPGTSDLDDDQPSYPVRFTLGDVRLARRLTR